MFDPRSSTDAQLLIRFEQGRDVQALAELIKRYDPLVRAVARRLLAREQDVEDAAQSTFLALARLAGTIRNKSAVASWLHRTAMTTSTDILRSELRWKRKFDRAGLRPPSELSNHNDPARSVADEELRQILDHELSRLPEHLRVAVILCDLQGLTQREAGERLEIGVSTVNDRVAKGRRMLRDRLLRRGVSLTVAALATCVAQTSEAASAMSTAAASDLAGSAALYVARASTDSLSSTSIRLADNVTTAMKITKLQTVGLVVLVIVAASGVVPGLTGWSSFGVQARKIVVVPSAYRNADAPSDSGVWPQTARAMSILHADAFVENSAGPIRIESLSWRPDGDQPVGASMRFNRLTIRMAITPVAPAEMSEVYDSNLANASHDPIVVFDNAWSGVVVNANPAGGPRPFDFKVSFSTPFEYDPTEGNLLVDFRFVGANFGGTKFDTGAAQPDQTTHWSSGQNSRNGAVGTFSVPNQFEIEPIPEPASGPPSI